jgi:hypothetical protein
MSVRQWHVSQALGSFRTLMDVLPELTEEEVLHCLTVEAGSLRRRSVINRLISRAARFNELRYTRQLKEKFHGTSPKQDHERR